MSSFPSTNFHNEHHRFVPTAFPTDIETPFVAIPSSNSFPNERNDQCHCLPLTSTTFYRNENASKQDHRTIYTRRFPLQKRIFCQDDSETKEQNENDQCDEFYSRQTITVRQIDCQDMKHSIQSNEHQDEENENRNNESNTVVNIQRSSPDARLFSTNFGLALSTRLSPPSSSSMPFSIRDHSVDDHDYSNSVSLIDRIDSSEKQNDFIISTRPETQVDQTILPTDQMETLMKQLTKCLGQLTNLLGEKKKKKKHRSNQNKILLRENITVKRCLSSHEAKQTVLSTVPTNSIFLQSDQDDVQRCLLIYCRDRSKVMKSKERFSSPTFTHFDDQEERFARRTINTNGNKSFSSCTWNHLPIKRYSSSVLSSSTMTNNLSYDVLLASSSSLSSRKTLMFADDDYEAFNELEQSLNRTEDD